MKDPFEQTIERYLRRWRPTLRPLTIQNKGYILRRFVVYLREQHQDVQRFSRLRRQPHIEDWLEDILYMKAASRNASIRTSQAAAGTKPTSYNGATSPLRASETNCSRESPQPRSKKLPSSTPPGSRL